MELIKKHAHGYQKNAIKFGYKNKSVYYAIDLGLGKTLISLALIKAIKQKAIVFGPLKPIYNTWPTEIEKWVPSLTYDIIHGPNKYNTLKKSKADILLINYDGLKWFSTNYKIVRPWHKRMLILDESSFIKDPSTQRFKMLRKLNMLWTDYKICLSATPAPNGFHELWTQYFLLDKGKRLGTSFYSFRNNYFHYTGPPLYKTTIRSGAAKAITRAIKPITYRLEANDYLDMPDIIYNNIPVVLPTKLMDLYKQLEDNFMLQFNNNKVSSAMSAAALGTKLRQFVQGAMYLDDTKGNYEEIHRLKVDALKDILEASTGKSILCPIQFKFDVKLIHKYIDKDIPVIAGGVSNSRATHLIQEWNKGSIPLLLCHPASIGHGTNLQSGGHILLWYSLTWSLEHYQQLNGRLYRQGQKSQSVIVNHLIAKGTKDEDVARVINKKGVTQASLLEALKRPT